jgi:epoxyqueuosine reductase
MNMSCKSPDALKREIVRYAQELGFDLVRIASAESFTQNREETLKRVRNGYMDGMPWYTEERVRIASDPDVLLPGARSFIAVALNYLPPEQTFKRSRGTHGKIARYAQWTDYHTVIKEGLHRIERMISQHAGRIVQTRSFVDDSALLERAVAERAGIGWFGKNTNILTQAHGSWVFLGYLLTDLELYPDESLKKSCGECTLCIPACPTGAIVAPYVLDARRCISYLTIENRGSIPIDMRTSIGDMVFGCDICQEVCPVNVGVSSGNGSLLGTSKQSTVELVSLLSMTQEEFSEKFSKSPIKRAKLVGMKRNACVALGNIGDQEAVPALGWILTNSKETLLRSHAAWALGRLDGIKSKDFLRKAFLSEQNPEVQEEICAALE